jgi:cytoskeleton protein RodZ
MNSIGARLRQERLRRGFDLSQIAELTKINPAFLEAIEADELDSLPGSFFTRSFVRQYAQALGLDEDEFEPDLRRLAGFGQPETAEPAPPAQEPAPIPIAMPSVGRRRPSKHSLSSLVTFVLILGACSVVYSLWQRAHHQTPAKSVPAAQRPAPSPLAPAAALSPEAMPALVKAASPTPAPVSTPSPTPARTATPAPASATSQEATAQAQPPAAGGETPGIRLELRATAEAWVRVVSDGKVLYSGMLQPNEARVFDGKDWITLKAGNAGALAVTYNGKPVGELGPEGQVRTIQFTPSGFKFIAPAPAKPTAEEDEE